MTCSKAIDDRLLALDALLHSGRPKSALETLCIQRQIADLKNNGNDGLHWDEDEAQRIIEFAKLHHHWKGPLKGTNFIPEPWQEHCLLSPLFGWKTERDGKLVRRFTVGYYEIPRKNGKTFTSSVIANQGLIADGENGPEVYPFASDKNQARRVFEDCKSTIRSSPHLSRICQVFAHHLECKANSGVLRPVASKEGPLHGLNPSRAIADELHAHANRSAWDAILSGMGSRPQPLLTAITTAGYDRSSICYEQHEFSRGILEGTIEEPTQHTYMACADAEDDPFDPLTWAKANPNLGISIEHEFLATEARKAQHSPSYENTFRRLYLNQWTQQSVRWLQMNLWDACKAGFDEEMLRGRKCYAAIDMASTRDVNSLACMFPEDDDEFLLLTWYWVPEDLQDARGEQDRAQVMRWAENGLIRKTSGNVADFDGQIPEDLIEILGTFDCHSLAYDPWGAGEAMVQRLVSMGFPHDRIVKWPQTLSRFAGPTKEFERLVTSGKLKHNGDPVLRWMAGNVAVKEDSSGNIRPDKANSADKIDGIVAAIMALGEAKFAEQEDRSFDFEVISG